MGLQAASTSKEKSDGHILDPSSSSLELYDSDADKEYFPDEYSCTDSEESPTSKRGQQPSTSRPKVKNKNPLVISNQNKFQRLGLLWIIYYKMT
ncbi:hypothetical protein J6590_085329 [Homalodisca vitripennis]|nr:hypothetical protein J6590_085329 [Homalodisca vitripennis]